MGLQTDMGSQRMVRHRSWEIRAACVPSDDRWREASEEDRQAMTDETRLSQIDWTHNDRSERGRRIWNLEVLDEDFDWLISKLRQSWADLAKARAAFESISKEFPSEGFLARGMARECLKILEDKRVAIHPQKDQTDSE
jgi:chlorite dismutase